MTHRSRYRFKSHKTEYRNVVFRSRLEAWWAAFFDRVGWEWEYEPIDLYGWTPDFYVRFECSHSECCYGSSGYKNWRGYHDLFIEVKPYWSIEEFAGHPCLKYQFGTNYDTGEEIPASAAFGINPTVTEWCMAHGAGGGMETIAHGRWLGGHDPMDTWRLAGNDVRWNR